MSASWPTIVPRPCGSTIWTWRSTGRASPRPPSRRTWPPAYPAPVSGCINIGLLHTGLGGADGHERYAPCTLEELRLRGYDYWALGHIHTRQVLCQDPPVVFAGNVQGRHIRETGPKGCLLATIGSDRQHRTRLPPAGPGAMGAGPGRCLGARDRVGLARPRGGDVRRLARVRARPRRACWPSG